MSAKKSAKKTVKRVKKGETQYTEFARVMIVSIALLSIAFLLTVMTHY